MFIFNFFRIFPISAENIYTAKLMTDLRAIFTVQYLRKVDTNDLLVSLVFNISRNAVSKVSTMETLEADKFKESLHLDINGNLNADVVKNNGDSHILHMSNTYKPSRHDSEDTRLQRVKDKLESIKVDVIANVEHNIMDQCSEDTLFYCWSGFDLENCINLDERCNRLRDLFVLFCMEKVHTVQKFEDMKEKKLVDALWRGYQVILSFPPKICNCTPTDMKAEFRKSWPCINSLWLVEDNSARREKENPHN